MQQVHIRVDTRPVVYNVTYSEEIRMRKSEGTCGTFWRRNNLVRVHNKNFSYSYKASTFEHFHVFYVHLF